MTGAVFHAAMWNQRYRDAGDDYLFGTAPNTYLARNVAMLAGCRDVLCVADGDGRNSVWLAEQGFSVTASDISPVAVEKARKLAAGRGVSVAFEVRDILNGEWPSAAYDAIVAIFIQFAAPEERAILFRGMQKAVRPGGLIVLQGYTPKQLDYKTGGPSSVENLYTPDLLRQLLAGWEILTLSEYEAVLEEGSGSMGHRGRSALIGIGARKPA
jgi:SAM-dependent methyltransferase